MQTCLAQELKSDGAHVFLREGGVGDALHLRKSALQSPIKSMAIEEIKYRTQIKQARAKHIANFNMNTPQSIPFVCAAMSTPGLAYVTAQVPEAIAPRPVVTATSDTNRRRFSYVAATNGHVTMTSCAAAGFGMSSGGRGGGIELGYGYRLMSGGSGGLGMGAVTARARVRQACASAAMVAAVVGLDAVAWRAWLRLRRRAGLGLGRRCSRLKLGLAVVQAGVRR